MRKRLFLETDWSCSGSDMRARKEGRETSHAARVVDILTIPTMDSLDDSTPLSYDEEVPYEKQVVELSLADRISRNKLYLLADSTVARSSKVRKTPRSIHSP